MKNNKKGFTLIELLAVIVVLAIIMVIATGQVTKTINDARKNSFTSSYKMIIKEVRRMIVENDTFIENGSDKNEIYCSDETISDNTATTNFDESKAKSCSTEYDISASDYKMSILPDSDGNYIIKLEGIGKFKDVKYTNNSYRKPEGSSDYTQLVSKGSCPVENACTSGNKIEIKLSKEDSSIVANTRTIIKEN